MADKKIPRQTLGAGEKSNSSPRSSAGEKSKIARKAFGAGPISRIRRRAHVPGSYNVTGQYNDPWSVLVHPLLTEKSIAGIERENKLVFIVDRRTSKRQIRWAMEKAFGVKVEKINTNIDRDGRKKALVKLKPGFRAADIATKFGML